MGSSEPKQVDVGTGEYAAADQRYLGDEQGGPIMDSFPADVVTYRIAITPPRPTFSTRNPIPECLSELTAIAGWGATCGCRLQHEGAAAKARVDASAVVQPCPTRLNKRRAAGLIVRPMQKSRSDCDTADRSPRGRLRLWTAGDLWTAISTPQFSARPPAPTSHPILDRSRSGSSGWIPRRQSSSRRCCSVRSPIPLLHRFARDRCSRAECAWLRTGAVR